MAWKNKFSPPIARMNFRDVVFPNYTCNFWPGGCGASENFVFIPRALLVDSFHPSVGRNPPDSPSDCPYVRVAFRPPTRLCGGSKV